MSRVDPRLMLSVGFLLFGLSNWELTTVTKDWDFWELLVPQVLRGFGMMLAIVPITNLALGTLPPDRLKNASGLFNLTRNLGGAVGLAALNTVLDRRIDLHLARLHESITWSRQTVLETLSGITSRMPGSDAHNMALKQLMMICASAGHRDGLCRCLPDARRRVRRVRRAHDLDAPSRADERGSRRALTLLRSQRSNPARV